MSVAIPQLRKSFSLALAALLLAFAGGAAAQSPPSPGAAEPAAQAPPAEPAPAVVPHAPAPAAAAPAPQAKPEWYKGQLYSWASFGTTFAYGQTYGSANVGVGWLMQHGIAPNVELGYAFGNSPTLWSLRPGVSWYLPIAVVRPYVGAFYTHWFVGGGLPDQNGIGGRAGFSLGRVLALGVTYEHALGCSQNCDSWAPQISAGYSF